MISKTLLNILLILFGNVFKILRRKYMLNLRSSDKTSEMLFYLEVQSLQTWLSVHLLVFISIIVYYCMGISLSVRPVDHQWMQLEVRFYSKWYCAMSGVIVLTRRFRLVSNRYLFRESANVKVCQYQVTISNGLFEETNKQSVFQIITFYISYI